MIDITQTPRLTDAPAVTEDEIETLEQGLATPDESEGEMLLQENPDGSVTVFEPEEEEPVARGDFGANLVESLSRPYLDDLGTELMELVQSDIKTREPRDKQYAEGIRRTGLGNDAPGGADFPGASKVVHPLLAQACVEQCAYWYQRRNDLGITSVGGTSGSIANPDKPLALLPMVLAVLRKYERWRN